MIQSIYKTYTDIDRFPDSKHTNNVQTDRQTNGQRNGKINLKKRIDESMNVIEVRIAKTVLTFCFLS